MPIAVKCGSCSKGFKAPDKLQGKTVKCPSCSSPVKIGQAAPASSGGGNTSVAKTTCGSCAHVFNAPAKFKGKKVKCPKCQTPVIVGGTALAGAAPSSQAPKKKEAFNVSKLERRENCPSCQIAVEKNQVVCTNCGFDFRTGKKGQRAEKGEELASSGEILTYVGGAILVLAGIGGFIYFMVK